MTAGKALNRTFALLAMLAMAILLAGCPAGPPRVPTSTVDRAELALRNGDYAGAAALYERLAGQTSGTDADEFRLRAARAVRRVAPAGIPRTRSARWAAPRWIARQ